MSRSKFLIFLRMLLVVTVFSYGANLASAQNNPIEQGKGSGQDQALSVQDQALKNLGKTTSAERAAAAARFRELKIKAALNEAAKANQKDGGQK